MLVTLDVLNGFNTARWVEVLERKEFSQYLIEIIKNYLLTGADDLRTEYGDGGSTGIGLRTDLVEHILR